MAVWQLDDKLWFPDPRSGEPDGLVAIGGDLSAERLLLAYSHGFFPWYPYQTVREPYWYCPLERYVIFPGEIHVSHSMRQLLRQHKYEVTANADFQGVIRGCSTAQGRHEEGGAWLGPDMIDAYTRLHRMGYAASVEVWQTPDTAAVPDEQTDTADAGKDGRRLVGGLYGVTLCNAFFGESMFSLVPSASKLALISLARAMQTSGGRLIDCQFPTPLFAAMGGRPITYERYMEILRGGSSSAAR